MKILYVHGEDNNAIIDFEQYLEETEKTIEDCWETCHLKNSPITIETINVTCEALEFGEIDKSFISFVYNRLLEATPKKVYFYIIEKKW